MLVTSLRIAKAGVLTAAFARVNATTFVGHAYNDASPEIRLAVEVLLDGVPVALLRAEEFDEDLLAGGCGDGCYGFTFHAGASDLQLHRLIEARIANFGDPVGVPIDLALGPFGVGPRRTNGNVEWVGGVRIAGTLSRRPEEIPSVRVLEHGLLVVERRLQPWSHRLLRGVSARDAIPFDVRLPHAYADGRPHLFEVTDGAGRPLDGSPLWLQAFDDGLLIEGATAGSQEAARTAWLRQLLPISLPFESYGEWRRRYVRDGAPRPSRQHHIVLIGDDRREPAPECVAAPVHGTTIVPSEDGVTFAWCDLRTAIGAGSESGIVVFAGANVRLHADAVDRLVDALAADRLAAVAFGDLEVADGGTNPEPLFFGAFDYERLLEQGYAAHAFALRTDLIRIPDGEGSGNLFRLLLALLDDPAERARVIHVPGVVATIAPAGRADVDALAHAVRLHLKRRGVAAAVEGVQSVVMPCVRVRCVCAPDPLVSIVIPVRDSISRLDGCLASLRQHTRYAAYELILVDNGSATVAARRYLDELEKSGAKIVRMPGAPGRAKMLNCGVAAATGDFVCLLSPAIETIDPDWLDALVSRMTGPDVGAVGMKLLRPDGMIRHGGMVLGLKSGAVDAFGHCHDGDRGYGDLLCVAHECSAISADCMLVRRTEYLRRSGFDERLFPTGFDDVDFCLRLRAEGKRIVFTPHAKAIIHTSADDARHDARSGDVRTRRALDMLRRRWGATLASDPLYSPFLNRDAYPFSALAWPPGSAVATNDAWPFADQATRAPAVPASSHLA